MIHLLLCKLQYRCCRSLLRYGRCILGILEVVPRVRRRKVLSTCQESVPALQRGIGALRLTAVESLLRYSATTSL